MPGQKYWVRFSPAWEEWTFEGIVRPGMALMYLSDQHTDPRTGDVSEHRKYWHIHISRIEIEEQHGEEAQRDLAPGVSLLQEASEVPQPRPDEDG